MQRVPIESEVEKEEAPDTLDGETGLAIVRGNQRRAMPTGTKRLYDTGRMVKGGGGECLPTGRGAEAPAPHEVPPWLYVHIGTRGLTVHGSTPHRGPQLEGVKRSVIKGLSAGSKRRLKEKLARVEIPPNCGVWAVTYTVPNNGEPLDRDAWLKLWKAQSTWLSRAGISGIWRVELTRKRQPHVHLIAFVPLDLDRPRIVLHRHWHDLLEKIGLYSPDAFLHSVHEREYDPDRVGWFLYLCAHSSKGKQSQLGWKGRQWGYVAGNRLSFPEGEPVLVSEASRAILMRLGRSYLRSRMRVSGWEWKRRPRRVRGILQHCMTAKGGTISRGGTLLLSNGLARRLVQCAEGLAKDRAAKGRAWRCEGRRSISGPPAQG